MTVEELARACAEALSDDSWSRKDEDGLALVRLTVTRRRDPESTRRARLCGRGSPLSHGPLDYRGHDSTGKRDTFIGEWPALDVLAYLAARGLIEVRAEEPSERGDS